MTIVRVAKRPRYVIVDKAAVEDARLSWKARGLLVYLLAKPDDWHVRPDQLEGASDQDGRGALRSAFRELEVLGYIVRKRVHGNNGQFTDWEMVVYEHPGAEPDTPPPPIDRQTVNRPIGQSAPTDRFPDRPTDRKSVDRSLLKDKSGDRGNNTNGFLTGEPADGGHAAPALAVVDERHTSAQLLLGGYLEQCKVRPPDRFIGHLAREIKALVAEDIPPPAIADGLQTLRRKGLHPSVLASTVNEALNPPEPSRTQRNVLDHLRQRYAEAIAEEQA